MNKFSIKPKHIYLTTIGTLIIALIIFNFDNIFCHSIFVDKSVFSDFGTFYGGLIGTIIAFFALYFIFRTHDIQKKQFDILKKDSDFNIVNSLYDDLILEINSLQFRKRKYKDDPGIEYNGIDALFNFDNSGPNSTNAILNHLQSIFIAFEHILLLAQKIKYKFNDQKEITLTRIHFLYYEKIIWPVYERLYKYEKKGLIEQGHPGIQELFTKYENLTKKTYTFLLEKKYVGKPSDPVMLNIIN